jgi:hypothetical protein
MEYYKAFRAKYKSIAEAQLKWERIVLRNKKITHITGLTFHYPYAKVNSSGYNSEFPSICNYPVQSLATAEVVPIALIGMWHVIKAKEMKTIMVNTVHDSAMLESPDEEVEEVYEISKWAFLWFVYDVLDKLYGIKFNVPLGVGFCYGDYGGMSQQPTFKPTRYDGEYVDIDGGEILVMAVPPTKMEGVDYSRLEK